MFRTTLALLLLALPLAAHADTKVNGRQIEDGSIGSADLAPLAVTTAKINDGAVTNAKLGANSVTTAEVALDSLSAADLAPDSVGTSEIQADAVTSAKIADGTVAAADLAATLDLSGKTITLPAANTPALTKVFTSTAQTITAAGTLSLAHGLGGVPVLLQVRIKCTSAELNYSVNDELLVSTGVSGANRGLAVMADATNVFVRFGSDANPIDVLNKTTGASGVIDPTKWQLIVRAWL